MAPLVEQLLEEQRQGEPPSPRRSSARVAPPTSSYEALKSVGERPRVRTSKMISWQESSDRFLEKFQPREFRKDDLRPFYHLSLKEAAVQLGICATTLKRVCRRLGIRKWPRRALARLSQHQNAAAQPVLPELSPELQQACQEPQSPNLQTCGSAASSATAMCKGSQSPLESPMEPLSPWAQPTESGAFDRLQIDNIPSPRKPSPAPSPMPAVQQDTDWSDPLPFVLDSWDLDPTPGIPLLPGPTGSAVTPCTPHTPHTPRTPHFPHASQQHLQLHDAVDLNSPALPWDVTPSSSPFPCSPICTNVQDMQHHLPPSDDTFNQSFPANTWSDLAMLHRALNQPEQAPLQSYQQSAQQAARLARPQLLSTNSTLPPALWDAPAEDFLPAPTAQPTAALRPPMHMPHGFQGAPVPHTFQGMCSPAECPFSHEASLGPASDCYLATGDWPCTCQQGPGSHAGPVFRGRVIAPEEYMAQQLGFQCRPGA
ncbi:hypothetical protein WJX74_002710 [Apatococcus lobatus]|uniref:RWP-RK domain-containing protein n=1 Tax=Apatococcus lobatus TaxID=904363 RepID=A0AAW1QK52_9CHLO